MWSVLLRKFGCAREVDSPAVTIRCRTWCTPDRRERDVVPDYVRVLHHDVGSRGVGSVLFIGSMDRRYRPIQMKNHSPGNLTPATRGDARPES